MSFHPCSDLRTHQLKWVESLSTIAESSVVISDRYSSYKGHVPLSVRNGDRMSVGDNRYQCVNSITPSSFLWV